MERYRCYRANYNLIRMESIPAWDMTINCNATSDIPMSASVCMRTVDAAGIDWASDRLQMAMQLRMPDGGWAEWILGTFVPASPDRTYDGSNDFITVSGYDQTIVLNDDKLSDILTIPAGTAYVSAIVTAIQQAGLQRIMIDQSDAVLPDDLQFEIGTSRLKLVNDLLKSINYLPVYADPDGVIVCKRYRMPYDRNVDHTYTDDDTSVIAPSADISDDSYGIPNVIIATVSRTDGPPLVAQWENTDVASPLSIDRRKRRVVRVDALDDTYDQASLDQYVRMQGYAAMACIGAITYNTLLMPGHGVHDVVYVKNRRAGISGRYTETGWTCNLSPGAIMAHTAEKVVMMG